MKNRILFAAIFLAAATHPFAQKPPTMQPQSVTETFFDKTITDPYRHLENLDDPEVQAWYRGQAEHAQSVLESIPGRKALLARMKEFDARFKVRAGSMNITDNNRRFYFKMMPEEDVPKVYWRQGVTGEEKLLFDPTLMDNDSTHHAVSAFVPNMDGSKVAIGVSANGSESAEVRILDVDTGTEFPEHIDRTWGG